MVLEDQGDRGGHKARVLRRVDLSLLGAFLLSHLGVNYRWAGDDPIDGFDCSGFVVEMLKAFGMLPHQFDTNSQGLFELYKTATAHPRLGVLLFFGRHFADIRHVGIALNAWQMIEAGGGGESTKNKTDAARQNAYIRIRPIGYRKDFLASVNPFSQPLSL